jgi:hypothetical protein
MGRKPQWEAHGINIENTIVINNKVCRAKPAFNVKAAQQIHQGIR